MKAAIAALALFSLAAAAEPQAGATDEARSMRSAYWRCVGEASIRFARTSSEPADTIVTAAFGTCAQAEADVRAALDRAMAGAAGAGPVIDGLIAQTRREAREIATALVIETRAARSR